ncbi:anthranilate 1,2-dioxygenase electron transfer component AntC [Denitratisoma sp. agr-D3]
MVTIEGGEVFPVASGDTLLGAALRAGLGLPYDCCSGACGNCRVELLAGDIHDRWPEAPGISKRDRAKGKYLSCQSLVEGDCVIRAKPGGEYVPPVRPTMHEATLLAVRDLTHDLREFTFRTDDAATFLPGQYALLSLPGVARPRAYSMSNLPNGEGVWQFIIRKVPGGEFTSRLFEQCQPGGGIRLDGPYGMAWLRQQAGRDIVCIAGGSGLAPMLSIVRGAMAMPIPPAVHFYYGARSRADVCGEEEVAALAGQGNGLRHVIAVSLPDPAWSGRRGFIHQCLEEDLASRFKEFEFYLAGPPAMVEAVQEMLILRHQVPLGQIHQDRFF